VQIAVRGFLVLFGLGFIALGYFVGVGMAGDSQAQVARAEQLLAADAAGVASSAVGTELLVEGRLSSANPAGFRDYVAYVREEFRGVEQNSMERWVEDERLTPPLLVEAVGVVRLANEDYQLLGPHERWQEEGLNWSRREQEGTKRYRGWLAERPVMVIGTVTQGAEGNQLRAELVFGGTRAEYIAGEGSAAGFFPWIGAGMALLGGALVVLGGWVLRRW
jgi:hypothetical protein